MIDEPYLTSKEAAQRLGVTTSLLSRWRKLGQGPIYIKISDRKFQYPLREFEEFQLACRSDNKKKKPQHPVVEEVAIPEPQQYVEEEYIAAE